MKRLWIAIACFLALAAPAAAKAPLTGKFLTTFSGAKPAAINGRWLLIFNANGSYELDHNELAVVIGHGTQTATEITFANEVGTLACSNAGKYHWTLHGRKLKLTLISDSCGGRRTVLARPFVKQ